MDLLIKYFPHLTSRQIEKYKLLHEQVLSWNRRLNLVSRKDSDHLTERHILHSLAIAIHADIEPGELVLDVGTGGGFPGLPLAIMFPETRFSLIDSIGKKITAVSSIARSLDLRKVDCKQVRAEDYHARADHVVSRAVTKLNRFTGWIRDNFTEQQEAPENQSRVNRRGLWYLKGGDLDEELKPFPGAEVFELKNHFSEPFFESKKLVWICPKCLS